MVITPTPSVFPTRAARPIVAMCALLLGVVLSGCSSNATTGRSQLLLMSWDQEIALGEQAVSELTQGYGGSVRDTIASEYITEVGASLAQAAGEIDPQLQSLPWEFTLLDSEVINAFALPGGKVFASRGLLERFDNEAQLALVLGHEIGHVAGRHGNARVSQAQAAGVAGQVLGAVVGRSTGIAQYLPMIYDQGTGLYLLSYGRSQELEADDLGLRYMVARGYDPAGAVQALGVLVDAAGGASQPEFFSTHPDPQRRFERMRDLVAERHPDRTGRLGEQDFRRRFLSRVAALDEPAHRMPTGDRLALAPWLWCGTCAGTHGEH